MRWSRGGPLAGLLCRRCTRAPGPRRILDEHALCLDLVGRTGKPLLTKVDFKRFGRKRRRKTETAAPTLDAVQSATPIVLVDQEEEEEEEEQEYPEYPE